MLTKRTLIGVMGSGKVEHAGLSEPLGRLLAETGCHMLNGAGQGTMAATGRAFTSVAGRAGLYIGICPSQRDEAGRVMPKAGYPNEWVELAIHSPLGTYTGDPGEVTRNHINIMSAHAIIALPGAHGTLNECQLALEFEKPLIYFGADDDFLDFPQGAARTNTLDDISEFIDHYHLN